MVVAALSTAPPVLPAPAQWRTMAYHPWTCGSRPAGSCAALVSRQFLAMTPMSWPGWDGMVRIFRIAPPENLARPPPGEPRFRHPETPKPPYRRPATMLLGVPAGWYPPVEEGNSRFPLRLVCDSPAGGSAQYSRNRNRSRAASPVLPADGAACARTGQRSLCLRDLRQRLGPRR